MANSFIVKHRYHHDPRLSASQVGEYLSATPLRRRSILQEAKFPKTVMVTRYEDAYAPIVGHLTGTANALESGILRLRRKVGSEELSEWRGDNCELCIEAIESFQSTMANLDIGKTKFIKPNLDDTKLKISGVNVSVSISMMTEETGHGGRHSIGAAILIFSKPAKTDDKTAARCRAVALLIYELLKSQPKTARECDPELCMAIDVFNGKIYRAMTPQRRLWRTVQVSCDEITNNWPSIKPPANYNGPPLPKVA